MNFEMNALSWKSYDIQILFSFMEPVQNHQIYVLFLSIAKEVHFGSVCTIER